MKKCLFTLLFLSSLVLAEEPDLDALMEEHNLKPYPIEKIGHRQFFTNHKYVRVESGKLIVESDGESTNNTKLSVGDVQYIGTNNGEWGGKLEVIQDGVSKELMKGNIVHLLPIGKKLYIIEGLAHLSMSGGSISVIEDMEKPEIPRRITLLPDAPRLVYLDTTRADFQPIIIVGYRSLMELNPFEQLDILHWDGFWSYKLSPTSITRYQNNFLIGLPFGVAAIPAPRGSQEIVFYAEPKFNK
ncbi:hypothetical protein OQJ62_03055 [Microbulbifer thermotolerans]|uniref:hypothetical protein n=1 Tax=Microbulbifer thermotolerans TaxID=252514 RepID=UPI002248E1B6|nr:hypothetical protein [Microbulbifer thermotolerans]MCX2793896.1 hypothetical protein [Microbulbifer thermotolerans]